VWLLRALGDGKEISIMSVLDGSAVLVRARAFHFVDWEWSTIWTYLYCNECE
jgi:hypothetical protein